MHNFIRIHDPTDFEAERESMQSGMEPEDVSIGQLRGSTNAAERAHALRIRDGIAKQMWEDYQRLKGRRRIEIIDSVF